MTTATDQTQPTGGLESTAREVADEVSQTAETRAASLLDQASTTVENVALAVRSATDELRGQQPQVARLGDVAADKAEATAAYLREHQPREILDAAQRAARQAPIVVIGGGLMLGFALGRLLRTASGTPGTEGRGDWYTQDLAARARDQELPNSGYGVGYGGSGDRVASGDLGRGSPVMDTTAGSAVDGA
jgi:hypothetical protein